jgi:hypothetical protein
MSRHASLTRRIAITLLVLTSLSCSEKKEEMDEWEAEIAKQFDATYVELAHLSTSTTVDGGPLQDETYLQLSITNSKALEEIAHNKILWSRRCDEIRDITLKLPELASLPAFNEFRLNFIKTTGFWIFKSQEENTVTYEVY